MLVCGNPEWINVQRLRFLNNYHLTHCALGGVAVIECPNFKHNLGIDILSVPSTYHPKMNTRVSHWWLVHIGSGNGLVPIAEPVLTNIFHGFPRP